MSSSKIWKAVYIYILLIIAGVCVRNIIGFTFLNEFEDWGWRTKGGVIIFAVLAVLIILEILKEWKSNGADR
jgi:hypothetical protein